MLKYNTFCSRLLSSSHKLWCLLIMLFSFHVSEGQLSITAVSANFSQNFNSMATSSTASIPGGFKVSNQNNTVDWTACATAVNQAAGTLGAGILSSGSTGGIYNFANGQKDTATDRCLGFLNSGGTGAPASPEYIILQLTNNTLSTIRSFFVSFDYEKYRSAPRTWNWYFIHGSSANPTTDTVTAGYHSFSADADNTTVYDPPQSVNKSFIISNLNIPAGSSYYFKWILSSGATGKVTYGQALGIDNFCIKAETTSTITTGCAPPDPADGSTMDDATPSSTSMDLLFSNGAGSGSIIIATASPTLTALPVSGVTYSANASYGAGSPIGGGYVVYDGVGPTCTVFNLAPSTTYYFFIFVYELQINTASCNNIALPCYCTDLVGLGNQYYIDGTTALPSPYRTNRFMSRQSGIWANATNWWVETNVPGVWDTCTQPPDEQSRSILIRSTDTISVSTLVSMDSVTVAGTLKVVYPGKIVLKNGTPNFDLNIDTAGILKFETTETFYNSFQSDLGAKINVASGCKLTIGNGGPVGLYFERFAYLSGLVNWNTGSIFDWNTTKPLSCSGTSFFPDTSASVIPTFRVSKSPTLSQTLGGNSPTYFYGLFEANAKVSFTGTGSKFFRNGITGTDTVAQSSNTCGQFIVDGATASFGGPGAIALASVDSMVISSPAATMISSKPIYNGLIKITGTLNAGNFTISGGNASTLLQLTGKINTTNSNGFCCGANTSIGTGMLATKMNLKLGTIDHTASTTQTITSIYDGTNTGYYGNLSNSGNGPRTYSSTGVIKILSIFSPGGGASTVTGSAIELADTTSGSNQSIPAFTYNTLLLSSGSYAATKTLAGAISILDSLKVATTTTMSLATYDVTLRSTATKTARVGITSGGSNFNSFTTSGRFIVERYIATSRKWQLLSTPTFDVSGAQTIRQSWQENAASMADNPNPGYGTLITTNISANLGNGFDTLSPGGPSMKYFDTATQAYIGVSGTTSTSTNKLFKDFGYFLFVRGDRTCKPSNANAYSTTLRSRGRIYVGPKGISLNTVGFASVGNFMPSAVDYKKIKRAGGLSTTNYSFSLWDPKMGGSYGVGGFITFSYDPPTGDFTASTLSPSYGSTGRYNGFIESGQAFFVNVTSTSTITFYDTSKVFGNGVGDVFRPVTTVSPYNSVRFLLHIMSASQVPTLIDGCVVAFADGNNNAVDANDAIKPVNSSENLAVLKEGRNIAIERRQPVGVSDTIQLYSGPFRSSSYQLEIRCNEWQLNSGLRAYLYDRYTKRSTLLNIGVINYYNFSVDQFPDSRLSNRFYIYFSRPKPMPFMAEKIVKTINTMFIPTKESTCGMMVCPNPVEGRTINFQFTGDFSGDYSIEIIDPAGNKLMAKQISNPGVNYSVALPATISSGNYKAILIFNDGKQRLVRSFHVL